MSPIQHSRLSSAIIFALLCINSSLASPVASAGRSPISIVDATEPVNIIDIEDLPPQPSFPNDGSTTTNDGTTVTTTYNIPRDIVRRRKPEVSIISAFEPVKIIDSEDLSPEQKFSADGSTTTNDGRIVTTTYNNRRDRVQIRKPKVSIVSAYEPVNVIAVPSDRRLGSDNSSSTTTITNDGTTVTTTYSTTQRNLLQTESNVTGSLGLINLKNQTRQLSELDMGLNCQGSVVMCVGATQMGVMHTLRDYMYAIPTGYRYYAGQDIACMKHNVYPSPLITWGFYCAFMQGNISAEGVEGPLIQLKMQQMIEHHCLGCGSVPFSDDNDPMTLGILRVDYVSHSECEGLCYYKPPGIAADATAEVPKGMTLATELGILHV